jgi:predicted ABC-type ATPase
MTAPTCWIIAGPNGAGKTTFALEYLPRIANCQHFINADLIAAGLSPLAPEAGLWQASRLFLRAIETCIQAREDFGLETTLAGRTYLKLIQRLQMANWRVELIYLALSSVEMSKWRVAERVAHGGHNIPVADIERRFPRSLRNLLDEFSGVVDRTQCYLNDGEVPQLIFLQHYNDRQILNPELFALLTQGTQGTKL